MYYISERCYQTFSTWVGIWIVLLQKMVMEMKVWDNEKVNNQCWGVYSPQAWSISHLLKWWHPKRKVTNGESVVEPHSILPHLNKGRSQYHISGLKELSHHCVGRGQVCMFWLSCQVFPKHPVSICDSVSILREEMSNLENKCRLKAKSSIKKKIFIPRGTGRALGSLWGQIREGWLRSILFPF